MTDTNKNPEAEDFEEEDEYFISVNGEEYGADGLIDQYYGATVGFPGVLMCVAHHLGIRPASPGVFFSVIREAFEKVATVEVENSGETFDLTKHKCETEIPYEWDWEEEPTLRLKITLR